MYPDISSSCVRKYSAMNITIRGNCNIDLEVKEKEDHLNKSYSITEVVILSYMY